MIGYAIDGVDLHDAAGRWDVLTSSALSPAVTVNSVDLTIPGVSGSVPFPGAPTSAPQLPISLAVSGDDHDEMQANYSALARLLYAGGTLTRTVGTTVATATMELQTLSQPVFIQSFARYETVAVVKLPSVYFRGVSLDWSRSAPASGTAYEVTTLASGSAPVDDALVLVTGPASSPKIACGASWAMLNLTLADGEKALIDCRAWTVRRGTGVTFDGGGTLTSGSLITSGGPYLLRLVPAMVGVDPAVTATKVTLTATGMTSSSAIAVRAQPAFLV